MGMLPELPNIRYVRVSENGKDLNLFRLDGTEEELEHALTHMVETYQHINPALEITIMPREEALKIEWKFVSKTCIPWELAKKKLKGFEVALNWN